MNRFFAPGAEFARIERMFATDRFARDGRGLGDDGFVWEPGAGGLWVAASDASAEGVHYRLDWATPAQALRKALFANLSDINAMGGRTRLAFFNLGARADWSPEVYDDLGIALRAMEEAFGFRVAGGDTATVPGAGFFSFTVLGVVEGKPLLRSGARPGHRIYVSGVLGGSSAGLALLRDGGPGQRDDAWRTLTQPHLDPVPPLDLGPVLSVLLAEGRAVHPDRSIAAIDISDGLSSELWHLARQSKCALRIDASKVPVHPGLGTTAYDDLSPEARRHALHGGEEYQLLFTGNFSSAELDRLRSVARITEIGVVTSGDGVFVREDGTERPLESEGYRHGG
jgi:thiamine-monophosphate kinase